MTQTPTSSASKILVVKLGALGDFIQALGAMKAIRQHHPQAHITLLTTQPYKMLATQCGYFNEIWIDTKPKILELGDWMALRKQLNNAHFDRVYDLQNNDRTSFYFKLFKKTNRPEWVGVAPGASHMNSSPSRTAGHAFDGHVQTLALAGIQNVTLDTLSWMKADITDFTLKKPYVLLVPGSAPDRLSKRWPAENYAIIANAITQKGFQPILLGAQAEAAVTSKIASTCPQALNLTGRTSLAQIVELARGAAAAIGNDTGPIHLIAATGCPVLALFSGQSHPVKHAPKGADVQIMREDFLEMLKPDDVLKALRPRI